MMLTATLTWQPRGRGGVYLLYRYTKEIYAWASFNYKLRVYDLPIFVAKDIDGAPMYETTEQAILRRLRKI